LLYQELAEHYFNIEAVGRSFDEEITDINNCLKEINAADIIDFGCGTGEHADALNKIGYRVDGLDSSETMVSIARERFKNCTFINGDMCSYKSERLYDAALCLFGSFNYLISDDDVRSALRGACSAIRPDGIFILEIWNASPLLQILHSPMNPVSTVHSFGKKISRDRGFVLLGTSPSLVQVNYVYYIDETEVKDRHIMRIYRTEEITDLVKESGFRVEKVTSQINGSAYFPDGNRLVLQLRAV